MAIKPRYTPILGGKVFSGGVAGVAVHNLWGFVGPSGLWAIEPSYEAVLDYSEGLAAVKRGGLWGFISSSGDLVIPYAFQDVMSFSEGAAGAASQGRWGYIDRRGAWMADPVYLEAKDHI